MGKAEFMTPKAIANRMKSKGLQKLRWYCQLCSKQCRDENGFKCHSNSEGHKRQLSLFASRPGKFLDTFSHEFEKTFLDELKRRFGSKRVHVNIVYNEYIRDKNHTHMNSTIWTTLTGFCKYLGRTGKCLVDETPKGWYISYVNRDPEMIARQEALAKKEKMDVDDEERTKRMIEKRISELAKMGADPGADDAIDNDDEGEQPPEFDPEKPHQEIKFSLGRPGIKTEPATPNTTANSESLSQPIEPTTPSPPSASDAVPVVKDEPEQGDEAKRETSVPPSTSTSTFTFTTSLPPPSPSTPAPSPSPAPVKPIVSKPVNIFEAAAKSAREKDMKDKDKDKEKEKDNKRKKSAVEQLMEEEERGKEKRGRKDFWITPGIVVKIMNKTLAGGKYYKAKGVVQECVDRYIAQVQSLDYGDVLKLDQSQLETVIPAINGKVKVVNGAYRGDHAVLLGLDVNNFCAKIKVTSGPNNSKVVNGIAYEDICKMHVQ